MHFLNGWMDFCPLVAKRPRKFYYALENEVEIDAEDAIGMATEGLNALTDGETSVPDVKGAVVG